MITMKTIFLYFIQITHSDDDFPSTGTRLVIINFTAMILLNCDHQGIPLIMWVLQVNKYRLERDRRPKHNITLQTTPFSTLRCINCRCLK